MKTRLQLNLTFSWMVNNFSVQVRPRCRQAVFAQDPRVDRAREQAAVWGRWGWQPFINKGAGHAGRGASVATASAL